MLPIPFMRRNRSAKLGEEDHESLDDKHRDRKPTPVSEPPKKAKRKRSAKRRREPKVTTWREVARVQCLREGEWQSGTLVDGEVQGWLLGHQYSVIFDKDGAQVQRKRDGKTMRRCPA